MSDPISQAQLNALMRPQMLCVCKRVPEEEIRAVLKAGAKTFLEVQARTNCSTGCGTCEEAVRAIVEEHAARP